MIEEKVSHGKDNETLLSEYIIDNWCHDAADSSTKKRES